MITFLLSIAALILGYFIYGKFIEKIFGPDPNRATPAFTKGDGVDYMPLPAWKIFMIQFLNIAGLGPIFGAIMGAKFGVASYMWIVFGTLLAGAVHDYMAGMISLRHNGESLPESVKRYLGATTGQVMRIFTVVLLILVVAVFVAGPAGLLTQLTPDMLNVNFWIVVIFIYYIVAALLPIDQIIGRVYPIFAVALMFMAAGIFVMLVINGVELPEITDGIAHHPNPTMEIFPMMFISIACGAISGFHASQSPMMARCMTNEKQGRPIFYGSMVAEGVVALIWAAAATYYFGENGMGEASAAVIVNDITRSWLGTFGALLATLGVIFAPITSGDTALRSARLIIADILHIEQKSTKGRMIISLPLFLITMGILIYSLRDKAGFDIIWRYFAFMNQSLSVFTLWMVTVYLVKQKRNYFVTLLPALFMTAVTSCYLIVAGECFALPMTYGYAVSGVCVAVAAVWFVVWYRSHGSKAEE
ncbi:MAG: carbon starvation CstA family protein [Rikenellaceae bacterium]